MAMNKGLYLPAIQGQFGSWVYYAALMRLADLQARVRYAREIHDNPKLSEMIQRSLDDKTRAQDISDYLIKTNDRFFNSLVVGVHGGHPQWHPFDVAVRNNAHSLSDIDETDRDALGYLEFSGSEHLFALDGQHRLAGIRRALEKNAEIGDDRVSVLFVAHRTDAKGVRRTRSLFVAINKKAVPVAKRDIIALDEVDLAAILTRRFVDEQSLFNRGQIDIDRFTPSIPAQARALTSIGHFYDLIKLVLNDIGARRGDDELKRATRVRLPDRMINRYASEVLDYLLRLIALDTELDEAMRSKTFGELIPSGRAAPKHRLLFRPVGLTIMMRLIASMQKEHTLAAAFRLVKKVPLELTKPPFKGVIWDDRRNRMITANATLVVALLQYMLGERKADAKLRERLAVAQGVTVDSVRLPSRFS
ncbi:DGQHR domain-containing protein [Mesorhizobium sp. CA5]|uniref:DGQHR domain-containing protein n=1 Tax=Mesorhizobium sp. CA5 TaxID=2876638 RepID=UPI001CD12E92|nr:DGQHR domain-containing protein [Mesorhizobium sp. CA5]MBZ9845686.1 DGQHR domain-containing protein [Mesorhizobium sp. CA5]